MSEVSRESYISFITSLKLCGGYIDFKYRIKMYIEQIEKYCNKLNIIYEIIICEDMDHKNKEFLKDFLSQEYLEKYKVTLLERKQDYENPFNHNMLEAPNKNLAISKSNGRYLCITSGDIFMNKYFFNILSKLQENRFYRFLSYEVNELDIPWEDCTVEYMENYCENNTIRNINPMLRKTNKVSDIAYKSGDIMLMDRKSWFKIRGFPECGIFHYSDFLVCQVVSNNKIPTYIEIEPTKIYTLIHKRGDIKSSHLNIDSGTESWKIVQQKRFNLSCN